MFYYVAFLELGTERLVEGGAIPQSKIREWADDAGLTEDQRDEFILIIMGVDLEYREWLESKRKKRQLETEQTTRGQKRQPRKR